MGPEDCQVMNSKPPDPQQRRPDGRMYFVEHEDQSRSDDWQIAKCCRLATSRDWDAAADQVPRCFILKTPVNCHCQLVLHSFGNIKPVHVRVLRLVQRDWQLPIAGTEFRIQE